ncbi:MAG: RhuM family protein [Coprobacillus sp.]|nr:RhuM family protein [Coprobacillus sp.]
MTFLDYAEDMAYEQKVMTMKDWIETTDDLLKFRKKQVLNDAVRISHKKAINIANEKYEKYRIIQDQEYISSMDEIYKKYLEEQ